MALEQRTQPLQWEDISDMVEAGDDAATILTALQADTRHKKDIYATSDKPEEVDLLDVLGELGLMYSDASNNWVGPLVTAVEDSDNAVLQAGMGRLYANFKTTNRPVRCYSYADIGFLVSGITATAKDAVSASAEAIQAAMDSLTGGLIWADVTEAEIQAVIDSQARQQAIQSCLAGYESAHTTATANLNNATASLADDQIADLTLAELQARCDAITASGTGLPA